MNDLSEKLRGNPIIAAIKENESLSAAIASPCKVLFLLKGDICTVENIVKQARNAGKSIYLHLDLMDGFGKDKYALQYIKERIVPSGIITTRASLIKIAKELNITVIQRVFLIDNLSFETGVQSLRQIKPDAVEILPGIMPPITKKMCQLITIPVITGGLINEKKDIVNSLKAGAVGVSTSSAKMWVLGDEVTHS
ncbi:MAG: glycerol-3-phosphate responsive antiterminator [Synergistaceae bacterium]|nr:glycerol-3-phosphate responsive antiterminator [Synergistaceae bacterium]